ncbi:hypothetical protein [Actinoplanes rectilineatus]|uniref:hypothetical protein n=1 Tax=Actinoplanes rectilineatus TaxID=113571 RepID=UPI0005F2E497|nr:hypothetical protein [Actinoplanes rectilineatus]
MTVQPTYAWCFSHGSLHTFRADGIWCNATWIDLGTNSEEAALRVKSAHFGDARFLDDLNPDARTAVLNQANARDDAEFAARPWCDGFRYSARCGSILRHAPHAEGEQPAWHDEN